MTIDQFFRNNDDNMFLWISFIVIVSITLTLSVSLYVFAPVNGWFVWKAHPLYRHFMKCIYCNSTNTTVTERQARAADEAITHIITCLSCKMKWRD